jgi:hypothetical protein
MQHGCNTFGAKLAFLAALDDLEGIHALQRPDVLGQNGKVEIWLGLFAGRLGKQLPARLACASKRLARFSRSMISPPVRIPPTIDAKLRKACSSS